MVSGPRRNAHPYGCFSKSVRECVSLCDQDECLSSCCQTLVSLARAFQQSMSVSAPVSACLCLRL